MGELILRLVDGARELLQEKMRPLADARVRESLAAGRNMALVEEALFELPKELGGGLLV